MGSESCRPLRFASNSFLPPFCRLPALSTTYMVGRVLRLYVKEERFIPVLEVRSVGALLNDKITKTEVHTPASKPFPHPPVADATAPPPLPHKSFP